MCKPSSYQNVLSAKHCYFANINIFLNLISYKYTYLPTNEKVVLPILASSSMYLSKEVNHKSGTSNYFH